MAAAHVTYAFSDVASIYPFTPCVKIWVNTPIFGIAKDARMFFAIKCWMLPRCNRRLEQLEPCMEHCQLEL